MANTPEKREGKEVIAKDLKKVPQETVESVKGGALSKLEKRTRIKLRTRK